MITPPILIYDGGDFIFFNSIQDVETFLEPFAIEEGETLVFDSHQQLLKFIINKGKWFDTVKYAGVEDTASELDLRYALASYISQRTADTSYLNAPWDNLISFVTEHFLPKSKEA